MASPMCNIQPYLNVISKDFILIKLVKKELDKEYRDIDKSFYFHH